MEKCGGDRLIGATINGTGTIPIEGLAERVEGLRLKGQTVMYGCRRQGR